MTPHELWNEYKQLNPTIGDEFDAWAFGVLPDELAQLVLEGTKTATASAYDLYSIEQEPIPEAGSYDVVLDSQGQAVCIIETTKISVVPFSQVSADHAYKEGEGDRSLAYWRQVHEDLFTQWLAEAGITFTEDSKVVLEEFRLVYPC
ncbi:ASCH domain-containing protein [Streptococcus merionis]|uniref:Acetyltransferase n=1 Tax=Streptococcus merionis TaxID=400065 RepID=A0A239SNW5_9STRE|nr:ASCH domain-containing protein [Streptococcus merionis]SNU86568.1 acetyltransferase [Streptococcus merionis]